MPFHGRQSHFAAIMVKTRACASRNKAICATNNVTSYSTTIAYALPVGLRAIRPFAPRSIAAIVATRKEITTSTRGPCMPFM